MHSDLNHEPQQARRLQPASAGHGPLLQRDYWAAIQGCRLKPSQVIDLVARRFVELPPSETVRFTRSSPSEAPLQVDDELEIHIRMMGGCAVRVIHRDRCSFTLGTLEGHPEAGRITFGAYRNNRGDVVFHIRSRVRSKSPLMYLGFKTGGDPMQTTTWTDFINSVALTCGESVIGFVYAHTQPLGRDAMDEGDERMDRPTFIARGD